MSEPQISGSCFCGAVRFDLDGPLHKARACHCSRCRKAFGGASSAYAELVPGTSLAWRSGTIASCETGAGWAMGFCSTCGTMLCGLHNGEVHGVALGSVDGDPGVQIEMHIFVDSRAPWDHIGGNAPQYAGHAPVAGDDSGR